jgi:endonuclease III
MKKINIDKIYSILKKEVANYNTPIVDLVQAQTKNPEKILIATILSARTKDEVTAAVVKKLFLKVQKIKDFEKLSVFDIEKLIYPIGFYKNKARFLKQLPIVLDEKFKGRLPLTVEELVLLPGVGRKTANLVVVVAFKKPAMCVDVHVHRISNRLGYIKTKTPLESEFALRKKLPKKYWLNYNSILVSFGQNLCRPISPYCNKCPIIKYCNRIGVSKNR